MYFAHKFNPNVKFNSEYCGDFWGMKLLQKPNGKLGMNNYADGTYTPHYLLIAVWCPSDPP